MGQVRNTRLFAKEYEAKGYTLVTPEQAAKWLLKNTRNRTLRDQFVDELAKKIRAGQWQPCTCDEIGFFEDGTLANGQHRLSAIVKAGVPVYAEVKFNIPMEAAICIDAGKSRTASDNIKIVTGDTYYTRKISQLVRVCAVQGKKLTPEDHLIISQRYKRQLMMVKDMFEGAPRYLNTSVLMGAVLLSLLAKSDEGQVREFTQTLISGRATSAAGESVVAFRDRLAAEFYAKGKYRHDYAYEIKRAEQVIWNFIHNKQVTRFMAPEVYKYPLFDFDTSELEHSVIQYNAKQA